PVQDRLPVIVPQTPVHVHPWLPGAWVGADGGDDPRLGVNGLAVTRRTGECPVGQCVLTVGVAPWARKHGNTALVLVCGANIVDKQVLTGPIRIDRYAHTVRRTALKNSHDTHFGSLPSVLPLEIV